MQAIAWVTFSIRAQDEKRQLIDRPTSIELRRQRPQLVLFHLHKAASDEPYQVPEINLDKWIQQREDETKKIPFQCNEDRLTSMNSMKSMQTQNRRWIVTTQ